MPELAARDTGRLYFLDNLRIALTILVIAHHVGQAYGPAGGWWPIQEVTRARILGPFFTVNRSFFMSLFFTISGYLMVMSYDRSGLGPFLRSRLLRLGVPLLLFFFLIIPLQQYLYHCRTGDLGSMSFRDYYGSAYFGLSDRPAAWKGPAWPEMNFGHLWYVEHLLIFSLCYAALRVVWKRAPAGSVVPTRPPPVCRSPSSWPVGFAVPCSSGESCDLWRRDESDRGTNPSGAHIDFVSMLWHQCVKAYMMILMPIWMVWR